jgi:hypothetical protein
VTTMPALPEPGPERHGDRRQPNLPLGLIDRWAQRAVDRPWRYTAAWAVGIGAGNLGLRMLLNDLSLTRNAPPAILAAVGFLGFAWLCTAQLTRAFRGQRPWPTVDRAIPKQRCAARWRCGSAVRRPGATGRGARSKWRWSCPRPVNAPARRVVGRPPGQSPTRRRLTVAAVAAAITLALLVGAIPSRSAGPGGGHDVVVPSWRD